MALTPGIHISSQLIKKLPEDQKALGKDAIIQNLKEKSGGDCFLCGKKLNETANRIVADHDVPAGEDSDNVHTLENLNLAHHACNSFKRGNPTQVVRPFLKFRSYLEDKGGQVKYDTACQYDWFDIELGSVTCEISGKQVNFGFPDGTNGEVPVYSESNSKGEFQYCFIEVPISAIHNDEHVQPRTVKWQHLWKIYSDLQNNPLHEPPGCRIDPESGHLVMFDGQHKTLATLLMKRKKVAVKVYFNLELDQANHLVNSIQAKVPKLPLSALELMSKMGAEWLEQAATYQDSNPEGSEAGFIDSIQLDRRARARAALKEAVLEMTFSKIKPDVPGWVQLQGEKEGLIPERSLKAKVLDQLLHTKALGHSFAESEDVRENESELAAEIVTRLINKCFSTSEPRTDEEELRIARCRRMGSLQRMASLCRDAVADILNIERDKSLGSSPINKTQREKIHEVVDNITSHPLWTSQTGECRRMKKMEEALQLNKGYREAFDDLQLNLAYAKTGDLAATWRG